VASWDAGAEQEVGAALGRAMRMGHWLLLSDAHTAPRAQLLQMVGHLVLVLVCGSLAAVGGSLGAGAGVWFACLLQLVGHLVLVLVCGSLAAVGGSLGAAAGVWFACCSWWVTCW